MFAGLSNMARALASAGMAVFIAIASGVEAHTPTPIYVATAVGGGGAAFVAAYGAEPPCLKWMLAGVVNAAASVVTTWGHADRTQVVWWAVVALGTGAGFTGLTKNGPAIVAAPVTVQQSRGGALVEGTVPRAGVA